MRSYAREPQEGDFVQRNHLYDGTKWAGKPEGPLLRVKQVLDHTWWIYTIDAHAIAILEDMLGHDCGWSFVWNLTVVPDGLHGM